MRDSGDFGGSHGFLGGTEGGQSSVTEYKGKIIKVFADWGGEGEGSLEYYRALRGNKVNFMVTQPKSSHPPSTQARNNDGPLRSDE